MSTPERQASPEQPVTEIQGSKEVEQRPPQKRKRSIDVGTDVEDAGSSFLESMGIEMVDLYVGPDEQLFRVHKKILCNKIEYFDKMFNGNFKETTELRATFPEDDPRAFDLLLGWVYSSAIKPLHVMKGPTGVRSRTWCGVLFYCLAEKFLLYELMDGIMDLLLECHNDRKRSLAIDSMDFVFDTTLTTSPLRKHFTHFAHYIILSGLYESKWPTDKVYELFKKHDTLLLDFLTLTRKSRDLVDLKTLPPCDFHWHKTPCKHAGESGTTLVETEGQAENPNKKARR